MLGQGLPQTRGSSSSERGTKCALYPLGIARNDGEVGFARPLLGKRWGSGAIRLDPNHPAVTPHFRHRTGLRHFLVAFSASDGLGWF
jgi:hypothetical protein